MGQMSIKNIKEMSYDKSNPECFKMANFKNSWTLCAASKMEAQEWYCSVKYAMRSPCDGKKDSPTDPASNSNSNDPQTDPEVKEIEGK